MENASDAIIMAGAMLIFVIALTVTITVFSQAKTTMDTVLYASDETNYYEFLDIENTTISNRIISWETIIPTLYKYYKENYTVVFLDSQGKGFKLYETQTNPLLWSGNATGTEMNIPPIVKKYPGINNDKDICSFDVDEETKRHEPWTGNTIDYKANLDAFIEGKDFPYPNGSGDSYRYKETGGSLITRLGGEKAKFRETIGEYNMEEKDGFGSSLNQGIRNNKSKRVIVYQKIQ